MRKTLRLLVQSLAYTAAAVVILLAIAVGLFRLLLPRLPEYQDDIKRWAGEAIGMQVEFSGMDARWGLSGPELKFYDAELIRADVETRALAAGEIGIGISVLRLLTERAVVVDAVTLRDTAVEVRQLENGSWRIQGAPAAELINLHARPENAPSSIEIIGRDIELQLIYPEDPRPTLIELNSLLIQRDATRIAIDAALRLDRDIGNRVQIAATRLNTTASEAYPWDIAIEANDVNLGALDRLYPQLPRRFGAGNGDIELSLAWLQERIVSASADVVLESVALGDGPSFNLDAHFAWQWDANGWLTAADVRELESPNGAWPPAALRVEGSVAADGTLVLLDAAASYANLADAALFLPWLDEASPLAALAPSGIVRDLAATVAELDTEPRYTLEATLEDFGVAASGERPGVRGYTGRIWANNAGGRLISAARNLQIEHPAWFSQPLSLDRIDGTVVWRQRDEHLTVVSDNLAIAAPGLTTESSLQIELDAGVAPQVDVETAFTISDIVAAKSLLPEPLMQPKQYRWYQDALLAGRIENGTAELYGSLDQFPFDNGDGRLRVTGSVRDLDFRYNPRFPVANVYEAEVLLDNMRLYSETNRSSSLGNNTVDARIEIADLREPVFTIQSMTTGTLESLHEFASNSPIARALGPGLARVAPSGQGSVALDLRVPIRNWREFSYTARLQTTAASVAIDGVPAPLEDLGGVVRLERGVVESESLAASFLGEPVSINLRNSTLPDYNVVGSLFGVAPAERLIEDLGAPLAGRLEGRTNYRLDVLFPRRQLAPLPATESADAPDPAESAVTDAAAATAPLRVRLSTDLNGLAIDLPYPYGKSATESRNLSSELVFVPGGERIDLTGNADNDFSWQLSFANTEAGWDFDRGVLALGDGPLDDAEVRGLHIRGSAREVRLDEWLAVGRGGSAGSGAAERIRSIDLEITDLYLLGQHLRDHRVRVDRSARDWLVQFDGEQVAGSVFVPYEFDATRELVLDMERLILPGDDSVVAAEPPAASPDPRNLPSIRLTAAEFAIGERYFGRVETAFERDAEGLRAESIVATDASFQIVGNGAWRADPSDPLGSRSLLTATLTSTDVVATMQRLGYDPGIVSDDMAVLFELSWSGGPRMAFFESLDGSVQVRFGSGQLDDVEPGAGRMFGLVSIVALPRRLSLDFRDVFQRGFGFDQIEGSFTIEDGVATTCNLSLSGPAADIGIIGDVDLVARDYQQAAVVSANVGNTLPVVGAVVAGPQAAAAMFLFSQIFKKPLQDIGQVYYDVSGSWDAPVIESTDAEGFTATGRVAGCLTESE